MKLSFGSVHILCKGFLTLKFAEKRQHGFDYFTLILKGN